MAEPVGDQERVVVEHLLEVGTTQRASTLYRAKPPPSWCRRVVGAAVEGLAGRLVADAVVAADGFHGVGRNTIPATVLRTYERASRSS
jgi:hypothetical protein